MKKDRATFLYSLGSLSGLYLCFVLASASLSSRLDTRQVGKQFLSCARERLMAPRPVGLATAVSRRSDGTAPSFPTVVRPLSDIKISAVSPAGSSSRSRLRLGRNFGELFSGLFRKTGEFPVQPVASL